MDTTHLTILYDANVVKEVLAMSPEQQKVWLKQARERRKALDVR